ncbi:PREDICTED: uncharacterized protein LOC104741038 [Camelina sativa]|uniref:Uncharacterized protein LOC104741038 n=1 Tax=Camelina sativa TaxID=90675 RepID=A0ABM1QWS7_CAMSA|nr:PREDICTED: uncharacterized protein LOC104741038 [Camelina sativa]XP_019091214.1 PREDICTED: uncharacterized protein LOC104741038 [Camelina sativa]XP_019091215.1 PREDICTED: uncharacterized protein LOC104741038 [Camelina sativa]XP_019091216.1 PREDICTED: uncharacterized protein LOC104741038 [Camelina sativa]XP_019091217.1 PREDICTED: uncharacterized protein LOC104741038 [Camelina sativa]XP_019091218.1 PREDICTED: uncharacterized protein LOC104741038 [Camelina sativa]
MSSTDMKPKSKPDDNQVISRKAVRDRLHVFMKGGGCGELFTACIGGDKAKDNREACSMLEKCMKARSDYFQPFFALRRDGEELMERETEVFLHAKPKDNTYTLVEKFMTGGPCKEAFMAWNDFRKECKKTGRCERSCFSPTPAFKTLVKCMEADRSNHYHPFLAVFKTVEEHLKKEIMGWATREQADAKKG